MRAISQNTVGGPEVLEVIETNRPTPIGNEVVVAVHAAGVNPTDSKHREGVLQFGQPPFILGWDVSGVVESVGTGVTVLKPGDEVFGMLPYPNTHGAYAEYVAAPARAMVRKPDTLSHTDAAALPLVAMTAYQALVDIANVRPGQQVLIHAGGGGVGHVAIQIAKSLGAYVIATASAGKHEFVRALGANAVIDYRTQDFVAEAGAVDVVLEPFVGADRLRSLEALRPGGLLVSLLPFDLDEVHQRAAELGVHAVGMQVEYDHATMAEITKLVEAGKLSVHVQEVFPFEEAARAHTVSEGGRVAGKLVIAIRD